MKTTNKKQIEKMEIKSFKEDLLEKYFLFNSNGELTL